MWDDELTDVIMLAQPTGASLLVQWPAQERTRASRDWPERSAPSTAQHDHHLRTGRHQHG